MLHHPSTSLKAPPAGPASCVFKCGLSLPCCSLRAGPESRHGEKQKAEVPHLEQWYDLIFASTCSNHLQPCSTHLLKRFGVYFHVFSTIPALLRQVFVCFHWHLAPWPHPQPLRSAGVTRSGHGDSTVLLQPWHQEIYQLRSNKFLETSKVRSSEWLHSHLCWVCLCLSRIHMPMGTHMTPLVTSADSRSDTSSSNNQGPSSSQKAWSAAFCERLCHTGLNSIEVIPCLLGVAVKWASGFCKGIWFSLVPCYLATWIPVNDYSCFAVLHAKTNEEHFSACRITSPSSSERLNIHVQTNAGGAEME